jgi:uncharacterized SAM-binding protein YcdF (DUF218 family)
MVGGDTNAKEDRRDLARIRDFATKSFGRLERWGTNDRRKTVRIESGFGGAIVILTRLGAGFILGYMLAVGFSLLGIPLILQGLSAINALPMGLIGAVIGVSPARWLLWVAHAVVISIALIVGHTPLIERPARSLVRADQLPPAPVDAVVVLSSGLSDDGMLDVQGMDRLLTAARMIHDGRSRTLVLSRLRRGPPASVVSDQDQQRVIQLLPAAPNIHYVDNVFSTHDEAVRVAKLAKVQGWSEIILITSPLHTWRACKTFEKTGLRVVCAPSESRDFALASMRTRHDRLKAFQLWAYERLAIWRYRMSNWIS